MAPVEVTVLPPKHEAFCHAYIANGMNATQAAAEVGYSAKTARVQGARLLTYAAIQARIRELLEPKLRKWDLTADRVLAEVAKVAYFNMGTILHITPNGDPYIDLSAISAEEMAAIGSAEIEDFIDRRETDADGKPIAREVRRVKVKPHDKLKALELGMRHLRLLHDKLEVVFDEDVAAALNSARQRAIQHRQQRLEVISQEDVNDE